MKFFYDCILPVLAFVMLSGFVTYILLEKNEKYWAYLFRRFLRLFPIYLFSFVISLLMLDFAYWAMTQIPVQNPKIGMRMDLINTYYNSSKILNILSHLTLTHGLFPNDIFPFTYTIMGQSWSLTLEWQFYIFIPFVYYFVKFRKAKNLTIILLFGGLVVFSHLYMPQKSFLPYMIQYFLIGYISYSLYKKFRDNKKYYLFIFLFIVSAVFSFQNIHISILVILFAAILYFQVKPNRFSNLIFDNRFAQLTGKTSYSIYCIHMIVLYCIIGLLVWFHIENKYIYSLSLLIAGFLMPILLSIFTYKYIEEPFLTYGKMRAKKSNPVIKQ